MTTRLGSILKTFGSGGANLSPGGSGKPSLKDVLLELHSAVAPPYADTAALTASVAIDRATGQLAVKLDDGSVWRWDGASAAAAVSGAVIRPTDCAATNGRWLLLDASGIGILLTTNAPAPIGTQAVGTGTAAAKDDHVHAHGNQLGGTLHANAISGGAAGFLSGADKAAIDSGMTVATKTVTILHTALTALGAVMTGAVNVGTALPADAHVLGVNATVGTKFQNVGDTDTTTLDVGVAGTVELHVKDASAKTTGSKAPNGATSWVGRAAGTEQVIATFDSDVNFNTLTAGSVVVTVFYFVKAP